MGFRIAIGPCKCQQPYGDGLQAAACEHIDRHLRAWQSRLPADLAAVPSELFEELEIDGQHATFGLHRRSLDAGRTLVVFQVFIDTWSRPTFLSFGRVGRLYAEGILVGADGGVSVAPDEVMWEFR